MRDFDSFTKKELAAIARIKHKHFALFEELEGLCDSGARREALSAAILAYNLANILFRGRIETAAELAADYLYAKKQRERSNGKSKEAL